MTQDEVYIKRCFELAKMGGNRVKSNPHVGSVIVHSNKIIGEGYHEIYGGPHAEINALSSIRKSDIQKLPQSTIYISLEPCNHEGKTPPCVNAIKESGIKNVVISCLDPNPKMQGKSVFMLCENGINVMTGILKEEGDALLKRFKQNLLGLPFVTIKFAQSQDRFIGKADNRVMISNAESNILTHKLRAENDAILVGTNTIIVDNPHLTNRNYPGSNPIRVILDRNERIPKSSNVLTDKYETIIITAIPDYKIEQNHKVVISVLNWDLEDILKELYRKNIRSLLVEGGAKIIEWFTNQKLWQEVYIIESQELLKDGVKSPRIKGIIKTRNNLGNNILRHIIADS